MGFRICLTVEFNLCKRLPTNSINVTASVPLKVSINLGRILFMLSRTTSCRSGSTERLIQAKPTTSNTMEYSEAISISGDTSLRFKISKAPSGSLEIVNRVCKMSLVVSDGLLRSADGLFRGLEGEN